MLGRLYCANLPRYKVCLLQKSAFKILVLTLAFVTNAQLPLPRDSPICKLFSKDHFL